VCGKQDWKPAFKVCDTNQAVPGNWWILICRECGLGVLYPMPDSAEIASYYLNYFYTPDGNRFNPFVEKARSIIGSTRGKLLRKLMPNGGRLLDFGAGAGHFGTAMQKAGWDVVSLDIATQSQSKSPDASFIMEGDQPRLLFPDDFFDVVTLWYVIEHMRNPRKVLQEMRRVLRPGGILLLAQQNFNSYQARLFGPRWLILDPPRHLYQFTPENLRQLTEQERFSFVAISHACLEMGPFTILQSILNTLLVNENYLFRFFKNRGLKHHETNFGHPGDNRKMVLLSLGLSVFLAPLALLTYYMLVAVKSGDIFTLYLRK
jgi:SAM-dependent methyltransferase